MANHNRTGNGARPGPIPGLIDAAPRPRTIAEYDVPDDEERLLSYVTTSFGSIRTICLKLLTPLEEKAATTASGTESIDLAYQLARRSIAGVINETGEYIEVHQHDGSSEELWAQMHPKLRQLTIQAYSDIAVPNASTARSFIKSRRIRA
jgi:hypothetical protein